MSTLERAIAIACEAHAGQMDKSGQPYILHPVRVMLAMSGERGRIVGVLHDVVEDSSAWSLAQLAAEGFGNDIVAAVAHLTRPKNLPYEVYIDELMRAPALAIAVKIRDLQDNLHLDRLNRLSTEDWTRLVGRYRRALRRLISVPIEEGI